VREAVDTIFLYNDVEPVDEPPELVLPEELANQESYSSFLCYNEWKSDYRYVLDNVMDPMHGTFLHKQSHSMAEGDSQAKFVIRQTDIGFVFEKEGQRDVNFDWTEWADTGMHWTRLEIPYPKTGGPGGNFIIVGCVTPIDETLCSVSSGVFAVCPRVGSVIPGASFTATAWKRAIGMCWSRTASCWRIWSPMLVTTRICISMIWALSACAVICAPWRRTR